MSLLGLDVGTSGCKAAVYSLSGKQIALSHQDYPLVHPRPGWNELECRRIRQAVRKVLQAVNAEARHDPVETLSISSQGEAVAPVNKSGEPLNNFLVTFDARAAKEAQELEARIGRERLFSLTGMPPSSIYSICKILWFKEHRPDIVDKTWKFFCVGDYVAYELTGTGAIDRSLAARTMALDLRRGSWCDEVIEAAGISVDLLPSVVPSGTPIGHVREELAKEVGFVRPVLVAAGGHDQACGALGAGVVGEGSAMNSLGTVEVICPGFDFPKLDSKMLQNNYCCYGHVVPSKYLSISFNLSAGLLLKWYRDLFFAGLSYQELIAQASDRVSSVLVLPHFVGAGTPHMDAESKGAFVGLTIETTKEELIRSSLDSLILEARLALERFSEAGATINELKAIGGGAKSARWLQMKANALGISIRAMEEPEAATLGAALLGGVAVGKFDSAVEAVEAMVRVGKEYSPEASETAAYDQAFSRYRDLYPTLKEFNHRLG